MNTASTNYELYILKTAVNNHLDRTLPSDANQALYLIQYQIDNLVWNIATSIYSQSGHKADLSLIRDLANARIESLELLATKQAEEARLKAEIEARRKKEEEVKQAEEARREKEAEERIKAEKERKQWIQEQRQKKEREFTNTGKTYQSNGINQELFEIIKGITVDQLEVDAKLVTLEASFAEDLYTDSLDMEELIMAVEEEFNIESLEHDFIKYRPLFSSAQEDEFVYSYVTVEDLVRLVQEKTFGYC